MPRHVALALPILVPDSWFPSSRLGTRYPEAPLRERPIASPRSVAVQRSRASRHGVPKRSLGTRVWRSRRISRFCRLHRPILPKRGLSAIQRGAQQALCAGGSVMFARRLLAVAIVALLLSSSGCCWLRRVLCDECCSGCETGPFTFFAGRSCGEAYWGDWHSHPPRCEPCWKCGHEAADCACGG